MSRALTTLLVLWLIPAADAMAQAGATGPRPQPAPRETTSFRVFGDVGYTSFTAAESFEAILGSSSGSVLGGGGEVVLPQKIFVGVRLSRFQAEGERVFVFNGERFALGIPMTVKVTPLLLSAGYRFGSTRSAVRPYVGGGIGWHKYEETSEFADADENVNETFTGYHMLGGAEFRLSRLLGVAGEAEWATVPDALGQDPGGVSAAFNETNLGGFSVRVKLVVGK
jgi:opacity protein-like surface antigen